MPAESIPDLVLPLESSQSKIPHFLPVTKVSADD